jgi:hypothetical protein
MEKSAVMVGDYRYLLGRVWTSLPHDYGYVNFIMLNPSNAGHKEDDPTITRCINFAYNWGFDGLYVTNLFAYRTSYPDFLKESAAGGIDVIGPENNYWITACAKSAAQVVLAWGSNGVFFNRAKDVMALLYLNNIQMATIGDSVTKCGNPRHPLYLKKGLELNHLNFIEVNDLLNGTGSKPLPKFEEGTSAV